MIVDIADIVEIIESSSNLCCTDVCNDYWFLVGYLNLEYSRVTKLPNNLYVEGNLILSRRTITSPPNNLYVKGDLDLMSTNITSLPNNLIVGGKIVLDEGQIISIPKHLWNKVVYEERYED